MVANRIGIESSCAIQEWGRKISKMKESFSLFVASFLPTRNYSDCVSGEVLLFPARMDCFTAPSTERERSPIINYDIDTV